MGKAPDGAVLQRAAPSRLSTAPSAGEPLVTAAKQTPASVPEFGEFGEGAPTPLSRSQARACDLAGVGGCWVSCCSQLRPRACASAVAGGQGQALSSPQMIHHPSFLNVF